MSDTLNFKALNDLQNFSYSRNNSMLKDLDNIQDIHYKNSSCYNDDIIETLKTGFGNNELHYTCCHSKIKMPLYKENYLNEFTTAEEKAKARHALGLYNKFDIDLSNYVTVDKLDLEINILNTKIDNIPTNDVDLSDYITKKQFDSFSDTINTNISTINNKIDNFDFDVDLSNLATKEELTTSINSVNTELSKKGTYSKPNTGIPKSDLSSDLLQELDSIKTIGKMKFFTHSFDDPPLNGAIDNLKVNVDEYHKYLTPMSELTITLPASNSTYVTNIIVDFRSGNLACLLKIYPSVKWFNGNKPAIKENTRYLISIVDNVGVWASYE